MTSECASSNKSANRGLTLTSQGSLLLGYAKKIAAIISEAEEELGAQDGRVSGELSLGASTTHRRSHSARPLASWSDFQQSICTAATQARSCNYSSRTNSLSDSSKAQPATEPFAPSPSCKMSWS